MKKTFILAAISVAFAVPAFADTPDCTNGSCTIVNQTMGDETTNLDSSYDDNHQKQINGPSLERISGNSVSIDPKVQNGGNSVDQSGATQTATGGASSSIGNKSEIITGGATGTGGSIGYSDSSSKGGTVGDSIGGTVTGGSADVKGGSSNVLGGSSHTNSGDVTTGGNVLAQGQNSKNENNLGQAQSNDHSGNSKVDVGQGQSNDHSGNSSNLNALGQKTEVGQGQSSEQGQGQDQGQSQGIAGSGNSKQGQSSNQGQGQGQVAEQGQGQGQTADNDNQVSLDASDNSQHTTRVDARTLVLPDMPATPATVLASANMIKETTACGPLQDVDAKDVTQVLRGGFMGWGWKEVDAGQTMHLIERVDENGANQWFYEANIPGTNDVYLFGNQQIVVYAVLGAGSAVQTGLGGGGSSMSWGQLAAGTSNSSQRMVADIQNKLCFLGKATYKSARVIDGAPE